MGGGQDFDRRSTEVTKGTKRAKAGDARPSLTPAHADLMTPSDSLDELVAYAELQVELLEKPTDMTLDQKGWARAVKRAGRALDAVEHELYDRMARTTDEAELRQLHALQDRFVVAHASYLLFWSYYGSIPVALDASEVCEPGVDVEPSAITGEPRAEMDTLSLTAFNSAFSRAVDTWFAIGLAQHDGVDSIYTEARKPERPALLTEILAALASAALSGAASAIGAAIADAIAKHVQSGLASHLQPGVDGWHYAVSKNLRRVITEAEANHIRATATRTALYLAEAGKSAFEEGIQAIAGPRVVELLDQRKDPIDAFFEGQKSAVTDAMKRASDHLERSRTATLACNAAPVVVAEAIAAGMESKAELAEETQKDETLAAWMLYQAQAAIGAVGPRGTDLARLPGVRGCDTEDVAGVITVDVSLTPEIAPGFKFWRGHLPGLSEAMLSRIARTPLKDLGLPIVFRMASTAGGTPMQPGRFANQDDHFTVRINERGERWIGAWHPWHKQALADLVLGNGNNPTDVDRGAEMIGYLTHVLTLEDLYVEADK